MSFTPKYSITDAITRGLTDIERARGFLQAASLSETWIRAMAKRAFFLESFHTTHIEGTRLSLKQAETLIAGRNITDVDPDDKLELLNYKKAFEFVEEYITQGGPITEGLLREIHRKLVEGVRGGSAAPGEYRKIQNYVANSVTGEVVYTPPPAYDVPILMAELVAWINQAVEIHPILLSGIAQYQLVHIHPFLDGNGRVSRLLSTLCLYRAGYDFKRIFTISEFYDNDRQGFYRALQAVRENDLDMTCWIEYFITGLSTQMKSVVELGERAIRADMLIREKQLNNRQAKALRFMLEHETMGIKEYKKLYRTVNRKTLQRDLKDMMAKGIVAAEGKTNRLVYRVRGEG